MSQTSGCPERLAVYTREQRHCTYKKQLTRKTESIFVTYLTSNDVIVMFLISIIATTPFSASLHRRLHHHDIILLCIVSKKLRFSKLVESVEQELHGCLQIRILHVMSGHSEHYYGTAFRVIRTLGGGGGEVDRMGATIEQQ